MSGIYLNPYRKSEPDWDILFSDIFTDLDILRLHKSLPEYKPTPLVELPALAKRLKLNKILVKDESHRFGLKAFKALGATYAIYRFIKERKIRAGKKHISADEFYTASDILKPNEYTFCTATDGNHGRGVAWTANKLSQKAVIYMPSNTVPARAENIKKENAEVVIVTGNYDDAVKMAFEEAVKNGWQIISDTSWPGYTQIPLWIMAGYMTLFNEIATENIDIVLIPAGVGALAGAAAWFYNKQFKNNVKLISVEPDNADCMLESIKSPDGNPAISKGNQDSIMAGLNCGTVSPIAWPLVKAGFDLFMTVSDDICINAMQTYYKPEPDDPRIISGESGAATMAGLLTIMTDNKYGNIRERIGLNQKSTVLLLNTEGDTDPEFFRKTVV